MTAKKSPAPSVKDDHLYEKLRDQGSTDIQVRSSMRESELVDTLRDH